MSTRAEVSGGTRPGVSVERRESALIAPEGFPYAYEINAEAAQPLTSWQHLDDLLRMIGITDDLSFLIVERTDASDRWAQAIGHLDAVVVELGLPGSPMRVARAGGSNAPLRVISSGGTTVHARESELWSSAEALNVMRTWLESATLGAGAELRTPDDWS